ncbi:MAG: cobyrinic acid a,c-diamide synthase [Enterocloster bolteae]|uniref:cobyrinate/hydrogenobyrinate a,c-diamide synthase n=1 Tax=Enterocloster bolteae TaxID=208479 RepID=UPI00399167D1
MAGVMIAAPGSGSGKTMVTCGLLTLLKRKGYNPAAFKCGPDYIDGLFHRRVLGVENGNLDSFFETGTHMRQKLSRSMEHHFVVAEGVMGYFDGLGGVSVQGSSFEIGRILGLPAILVVDGRGASVSLMALIQGFLECDTALLNSEKKAHGKTACDAECAAGTKDGECSKSQCNKSQCEKNAEKYHEKKTHELHRHIYGTSGCFGNRDENNNIGGIFFNRMSPMIYNRIKPMVEELFRIPVIGYLPELNFLHVGSRHLGLVLPDEIDGIREQLEQLADRMDENLEWEPLLKIASEAGGRDREVPVREEAGAGQQTGNVAGIKPGNKLGNEPGNIPHFRLGIARDEAFCFYYEDNLRAMEQAGARLVYFSLLHQEKLPDGLDGLILGGGYPENHGEALAANRTMRDSVAAAAASGMPILAECGGYLYLLDSLEGADGTVYPMAGVLKGHGYRAGKTGRFGYITLGPNRCLPYLREGEEIKGHEFHYWDCDCGEDEFCMTAAKPKGGRSWPCMRTAKQVMAGFPHLYYPSCPGLVRRFAGQCVEYGQRHDRKHDRQERNGQEHDGEEHEL